MPTLASWHMCADAGDSTNGTNPPRGRAGRPKLGRPRRVRITTTIEPIKLILLRDHAERVKKSLGQLADEYVDLHFVHNDAARSTAARGDLSSGEDELSRVIDCPSPEDKAEDRNG